VSEFRYLFSPLKIGTVVVPNRIHFAAHMTNFAEDQKISERHIYYYRERAKGGCGLITTEELTVHPTDHAYDKLVDAFEPEVIPGFRALTNTVHEYETRIFAQLNHNGSQGDGKISRLPVWGPSPSKDPIFRETCKAMEIEDIKECVSFFAKSAVHAVEGGFDGIELQVGHSSLIRQFLSPASNFREDDYGGSFENRMRFCLEVVAAVRRAVGSGFTLGVRLNADEMHPQGGLTLEDAKTIAKRLEATGHRVLLIDLDGHHQATGTAEFLAEQGKEVHMLCPALFIGGKLGPLQDLYLTRQRLARKGVTFTPDIAVLGIQGTLAKGLNVYSNKMMDFTGYDTIVLAAGNESCDRLYFALKGKVKELYRIGDCVAPRKTDMAIVEGHRVGRQL